MLVNSASQRTKGHKNGGNSSTIQQNLKSKHALEEAEVDDLERANEANLSHLIYLKLLLVLILHGNSMSFEQITMIKWAGWTLSSESSC